MRILEWSARALACLAMVLLAGCATPSFEPGVTLDQVPVEAPMVFTGTHVQIVDWVGTIDDKDKRAAEIKETADDLIRQILAGSGLALVCAPPTEGRYTVLDVNLAYKAYEPLLGGGVTTAGEVRENDRVLMKPAFTNQMSFFLQSYAVKGSVAMFANLLTDDLKRRYTDPTKEQMAALQSCTPTQPPSQKAARKE
jgi:hypothetical protein